MSATTLLFTFFFSVPLFAATYEVPIKEGDRLVLKGFEAQVQIIAQPGNVMKISGVEESSAEGVYVVEKKGNLIEIRMNEFDGKRAWVGALPKAAAFTKKIEIFGAPVPVDVHLRGGTVNAQKWTKELKVTMQQGKVYTNGGAGAVQVSLQKGELSIQDHVGKVRADMYSGNLVLRNISGDVDAALFTGQLVAEKLKGFSNISTQQANGKVNQSGGTLQFENGKGSLTVQAFQGRIEGQSADGSINITMNMDSEVDVRAKAGRVSVQTPTSSGMSLNLVTVEGDITVPSELKVAKSSAEKSVRGRLKGESQRGSVFVRSQEASILVK